jgi:ABC-type branched-subunit amino acid transport system substrate-binding protein
MAIQLDRFQGRIGMPKNIKTALTVAAAVLGVSIASVGSACAQDVIRVGVTLRMLDEAGQVFGQMIVDEFDAVNKAGGINGHKIETILLNDECKPDKGVANVNRFIHQNRVHVIIGSTCSSVTLPLVDITAKEGVAQITPQSSNSVITGKGSPWIFRPAVAERFSRGVYAKYAVEDVGKKIAVLYTSDGAGSAFAKGLIETMKDTYGLDPVYANQVQETDVDVRPHLLKIKSLNPDVLAIGGQADSIARILQQSYEVGIPAKVQRVGSLATGNASTAKLAGDAAKGAVFIGFFIYSDPRPNVQKWVEMMKTKYKLLKPDHDVSMAWDTAQLVKIALQNSKLKLTDDALAADRAAIRDALANIHDYKGLAAGTISFCADPTPQCRDGNRTPVFISYVKGGADYEMKLVKAVTLDIDTGNKK